MTLLDLLKILKRHLALVIIIPVICAVAGYGYGHVTAESSWSAKATINGTGSWPTLTAIANGIIGVVDEDEAAQEDYIKLTVAADANNSVVFTATGSDGDKCVEAANKLLDKTIAQAEKEEILVSRSYDGSGKYREIEPRFSTTYATKAIETAKSNTKKYAAVGLLGGLFLIVFILVAIASVKGTIVDTRVLEEKLGVRRFGNSKDALAVDLQLAKDDAKSVLVVPLAPATQTAAVQAALPEAGEGLDAEFSFEESLVSNPKGALKAAGADAVVLAIEPFVSTYSQLDETVRQLDIAKAKLIGFFEVPKAK